MTVSEWSRKNRLRDKCSHCISKIADDPGLDLVPDPAEFRKEILFAAGKSRRVVETLVDSLYAA